MRNGLERGGAERNGKGEREGGTDERIAVVGSLESGLFESDCLGLEARVFLRALKIWRLLTIES